MDVKIGVKPTRVISVRINPWCHQILDNNYFQLMTAKDHRSLEANDNIFLNTALVEFP